jgi:hypothetical protein
VSPQIWARSLQYLLKVHVVAGEELLQELRLLQHDRLQDELVIVGQVEDGAARTGIRQLAATPTYSTSRTELWVRFPRDLHKMFLVCLFISLNHNSSVADPKCLSRIPDPNFSIPDPGSKRFLIPNPDPHKKCLVFIALKTVSKLSKNYLGCSSRIPDPW